MKPLLGIVAVIGLAAGPVVFAGQSLLADSANGPDWRPATDLVVTKAHCDRWYGVVSTCTVHYGPLAGEQEFPSHLNFFVNGSWAHERAALVISTKNPAVVSTAQGIRDLQARQMTMAVWVAGWLALLGAVLVGALRKRDARTDQVPTSMLADAVNPAAASAPVFAGPRSTAHDQTTRAFGRRGRS